MDPVQLCRKLRYQVDFLALDLYPLPVRLPLTVPEDPGIGTLAYESARYKDYNLLMVVSLLSGIIVIVCNMAAQILNERIDPRIRISRQPDIQEVREHE